MADLLRTAKVGVTREAVNAGFPQERADGPTLGALLRCYGELQRVVEERLAQAEAQPLPEVQLQEAKVP